MSTSKSVGFVRTLRTGVSPGEKIRIIISDRLGSKQPERVDVEGSTVNAGAIIEDGKVLWRFTTYEARKCQAELTSLVQDVMKKWPTPWMLNIGAVSPTINLIVRDRRIYGSPWLSIEHNVAHITSFEVHRRFRFRGTMIPVPTHLAPGTTAIVRY